MWPRAGGGIDTESLEKKHMAKELGYKLYGQVKELAHFLGRDR